MDTSLIRTELFCRRGDLIRGGLLSLEANTMLQCTDVDAGTFSLLFLAVCLQTAVSKTGTLNMLHVI